MIRKLIRNVKFLGFKPSKLNKLTSPYKSWTPNKKFWLKENITRVTGYFSLILVIKFLDLFCHYSLSTWGYIHHCYREIIFWKLSSLCLITWLENFLIICSSHTCTCGRTKIGLVIHRDLYCVFSFFFILSIP